MNAQPPQPQGFTTLEDIPEEPASTADSRAQTVLEEKKPVKPKKWVDDKRIAIIIAIIGFIIIGVVFYFLFHSIGVI